MADVQLSAYAMARFPVVAIASRRAEKAAEVANRWKIPTVHQTPRQLIENPNVEIIDIAFPPDLQPELIRHALKQEHVRGILAQKPLAMNLSGRARAKRDSTPMSISNGEWKAWTALPRVQSDGRTTQPDRLQRFATAPGRQPMVIGSNHPWDTRWFPHAFAGVMEQLQYALKTGAAPMLSASDNLKTMALVAADRRRHPSACRSEHRQSFRIAQVAKKCPPPCRRIRFRPAILNLRQSGRRVSQGVGPIRTARAWLRCHVQSEPTRPQQENQPHATCSLV
jgi:hypothetical protein